jgi:hypothetical protein
MTISKTYTRTWPSIDAIKRANRQAGSHFFDPSTLRFFDSRVLSGVIGGRYFITSERFHGSDGSVDPRRYTVRIADDAGRVDTVGDFQEWPTARQARAAAKRIARGASVGPVDCLSGEHAQHATGQEGDDCAREYLSR